MKIVIAMDSFKECMSAKEACQSVKNGLEKGFEKNSVEYKLVPMADGGEGTVQSLVDATNGKIVNVKVTGPLNTIVDSFYGILGDGKTAVIEMSAASGIHLVPADQRNPLVTTTKGTGELIDHAINSGVKKIIMGIGGSATNDCGLGMAQALGYKFYDSNDNLVADGGGELGKVARIDTTEVNANLKDVEFDIACDVTNPLTGETGASHIFGPQKGATPQMVEELDSNLGHFAKVIKEQLDKEIVDIPGAGAAGGLGGGSIAFLNATLKRGIDIVTTAANLSESIEGADLVITGEGRIDHQSVFGKTPIGVAKIAKKYNVATVAIVGSKGHKYTDVFEHGIDSVHSIVPGCCSIEDALSCGIENIEDTAENIARLISIYK